MKKISYTKLINEKKEVVIVINPLLKNGLINFKIMNDNDLILENEKETFIFNNFFTENKSLKSFLLVEYGAYGFHKEHYIKLY